MKYEQNCYPSTDVALSTRYTNRILNQKTMKEKMVFRFLFFHFLNQKFVATFTFDPLIEQLSKSNNQPTWKMDMIAIRFSYISYYIRISFQRFNFPFFTHSCPQIIYSLSFNVSQNGTWIHWYIFFFGFPFPSASVYSVVFFFSPSLSVNILFISRTKFSTYNSESLTRTKIFRIEIRAHANVLSICMN